MGGRTLRVALLGVRVQEARRYHVSIQVLAPGQAPVGVVVLSDVANEKYRPEQVARTETSELSQSPEFLNRVFVLRLSEPLGHSLAPQISLHCNLFALPSVDSATPGAMVAGKEVDELMGSATVQIRGEMAARLLRGESVTLPVLLNESRGDEQIKGTKGLMASVFGVRAGKELLLELRLLDALVTLPRDAYAMQAAGGTTHGNTGMSRPPVECTLMVLVSRAENLPTVRSEGGGEQEPSTFVAAKSLRDVRNSVTAQQITHVCPGSVNPVWGQVLQVKYHEEELAEEELHLALVNDQDSRLMLKATVPLAHVQPRQHYNLKLLMHGGPLGSPVVLYVTLCLLDCPKREVRHLKALGAGGVTHVASARMADSTAPLHTLLPTSSPAAPTTAGINGLTPGSQVLAVWSMPHTPATPPPAAAAPAAPAPQADGAAGEAGTKSKPSTPPPPAPAPAGRPLPAPLPADALYVPLDTRGGQDGVSQQMERLSERLTAACQGGGGVLDALPVHVVPPLGITLADQLVWPPDHMAVLMQRLEAQTRVQLQLHLLSPGAAQSTPMAVVDVPRDKLDALRGGVSVVEALALRSPQAPGAHCTLEMSLWKAPAYQEHLQKLRPGEEDEGPSMINAMSWQDRSGGGASLTGGGAALGNVGATASVLETLVDDLMVKQLALERVARTVDGLECRAEMMAWRLSDAEHRHKVANEDNHKLRQLLHEEKEASRLPVALENSAHLSKEDLVERCEAALAAYGRERRRNTELVHRLQQMHGEQVDMLEMKKRYQELQAAHMEMTKLMTEMEGPVRSKVSTYRTTIKTQEEVIKHMEALLKQQASKAKAVQSLTVENKRLREELYGASTRVDPSSERRLEKMTTELTHLQSARQELGDELSQLRDANHELASANAQLNLKVRQAEERTNAAREELVSAIKRYAAEIADLKWRLAEKDAQMMGGFGSPARLQDPDDDLGLPRVNPAAFTHIQSATGVANTPPRSPSNKKPQRTNSANGGNGGAEGGAGAGTRASSLQPRQLSAGARPSGSPRHSLLQGQPGALASPSGAAAAAAASGSPSSKQAWGADGAAGDGSIGADVNVQGSIKVGLEQSGAADSPKAARSNRATPSNQPNGSGSVRESADKANGIPAGGAAAGSPARTPPPRGDGEGGVAASGGSGGSVRPSAGKASS